MRAILRTGLHNWCAILHEWTNCCNDKAGFLDKSIKLLVLKFKDFNPFRQVLVELV